MSLLKVIHGLFIYMALLLSNYFVEYNKHTNWIYINYATYPTHTTLRISRQILH